MFRYKGAGLSNVWLKNGYTEKETPYGKATAIHDREGLHKAIGLYIVHNRPDLRDEEIRFFRKELDITQKQMADWLDVSESTVRNWESSRQVMPKTASLVLRGIYLSYIHEDSDMKRIIDRMAELNREEHLELLELEDTNEGWKKAAA